MDPRPPLPTVHPIPTELVEQWTALPPDGLLQAQIKKRDIDNLFFAINQLIQSQSQLQDCLFQYSNGAIEDASMSMDLSRRSSIESLNWLRNFLTSVISAELHARSRRQE